MGGIEMSNAQWKKYTGSDEQIKELWNADDGYILRFSDKVNDRIRRAKEAWLTLSDFSNHCKKVTNVTNYLICNPHPLEDMICQQARTGQPVWVRYAKVCHFGQTSEYEICNQIATLTPDWNIPGAEYSFTPFEGEL